MTNDLYEKLNELVKQFPPRVGPAILKLTRTQIALIPKATPSPYGPATIGDFGSIPVQLVWRFEESTPHLEGWTVVAQVSWKLRTGFVMTPLR